MWLAAPRRATNPRTRAPTVRLVGAAVLLLMMGLGSCGRRRHGVRRVVIGVAALRISLPVFAALDRGHFVRRGLDVDVRRYPTAQPMVDDVVAGRIDAAGFAAYPITAIATGDVGRNARVVASLLEDREHRLSYVLGRRGTALRFPRDAAGRSVGILPTIAYRRWLDAILRAAGVDVARVTVVPVQPPMQTQTLAEGGVDMLFTNDPMATAMLARGVAEIIDDGPPCAARLGDPFAFGSFVISGRFADARRADAAAVVHAVDDGIDFVRTHEADARIAMARHLRPDERDFVQRYPQSRYLRSDETPSDHWARAEGVLRTMGMAGVLGAVTQWSGPRAQ